MTGDVLFFFLKRISTYYILTELLYLFEREVGILFLYQDIKAYRS